MKRVMGEADLNYSTDKNGVFVLDIDRFIQSIVAEAEQAEKVAEAA